MTMMTSSRGMFLFLLSLVALLNTCCLAEPAKVYFVNFSTLPIKLHWYDVSTRMEVYLQDLPPYQVIGMDTQTGHAFAYYIGDSKDRKVVSIDNDNSQHPTYLLGQATKSVNVGCSTTEGDLHAVIMPEWSPHGAARFLELVDMGYFDGCALNRVVKKFLTQFGIAANYEMRTEFRQANIPDDHPPRKIDFEPGFLSYAGSGPDSRSTEVFVVMPGVAPHQLSAFGADNSWETPFGYVVKEDLESVVNQWYAYGDMPPWGEGPDPQEIYRKGGYDEYLKTKFPKMSYLQKCRIVNGGGGDGELAEEEL